MLTLNDQGDHITFEVIVQPRAGADSVVGELNGALKIRIAAPPVEGQANEACERFLSRLLGVRRADVKIVSGTTSKRKLVRVRGLNSREVLSRLRAVLPALSDGD
jgi:hypothetical protein